MVTPCADASRQPFWSPMARMAHPWYDTNARLRRSTMHLTPTLSYSHGTSTTPLLGETIGANLERACTRFGDREALVDVVSGRRWTYAQLNADVDTLALGLLDLGVDKGDRVGIWAPNCPEWT